MSWNLPPGCTQADIDRAMSSRDPSEAAQNVEAILDKAGFGEKFIESILAQIRDEEDELEEERAEDAAETRAEWERGW